METSFLFRLIVWFEGFGRNSRASENWFMGWRLLHLHEFSESNQLLCGR